MYSIALYDISLYIIEYTVYSFTPPPRAGSHTMERGRSSRVGSGSSGVKIQNLAEGRVGGLAKGEDGGCVHAVWSDAAQTSVLL